MTCSLCLSPARPTGEPGMGRLFDVTTGDLVPNVCAEWRCEHSHRWMKLIRAGRS